MAKEMLRAAYESVDEDWQSFGQNIGLIVFIGTPHRGAHLANVVKFFFPRLSSQSTTMLSGESGYLNDLFNGFRDLANKKKMDIVTYYETLKTKGVALVVNATSADPGYITSRPIPVDADHIEICKPTSRDQPIYPSILRHLTKFILKNERKESVSSIHRILWEKFDKVPKLQDFAFDLAFEASYFVEKIEHWSRTIQVLGMSKPLATASSTIPLIMSSTPRRFFIAESYDHHVIDENEIIKSGENYLILGDPGSGKTTEVKRLINAFVKHLKADNQASYPTPFLVIARDIKPGYSIYQTIADELGLPYEYRKHDGRNVGETTSLLRSSESGDFFFSETRLENFIHILLTEMDTVLFVDGIDEIETQNRQSIESELERLSRIPRMRIVCTRRSGDYGISRIEGYCTAEISNLSWPEIEKIVSLWAHDPDEFSTQLSSAPYVDTANRPLLLVQLILIFNSRGQLPAQAKDVYNQVVVLCLEVWDNERRVVRKSAYSGFTSERKLEFLSALSYHITYFIEKKRFTHETLLDAYRVISSQFRLPSNEAILVCREIESHTGLIFESAGSFEFSHLSLQEYLAANHMVRLPFDPIMAQYLEKYPAPLAVAVSLSSNPSGWLASLIYFTKNFAETNERFRGGILLKEDTVVSFLRRMTIEKPIFSVDLAFGLALIRLLGSINSLGVYSNGEPIDHKAINSNVEVVRQFLRMEGVLDSVKLAFENYFFDTIDNLNDENEEFTASRGLGILEEFSGRLPDEISFKKSVIRFFAAEFKVQFRWVSAEEEIITGPLPF